MRLKKNAEVSRWSKANLTVPDGLGPHGLLSINMSGLEKQNIQDTSGNTPNEKSL